MKNKSLKIKKQSKFSLLKQNINTLKKKFTPIEIDDENFVIQKLVNSPLEVSFDCPCCNSYVKFHLFDFDVKLLNVMCPCCGQVLHSKKLDNM